MLTQNYIKNPTFEDLLDIIKVSNSIISKINKTKCNKNMLLSIFNIGYLDDGFNWDDYFFSMTDNYELSIYKELYWKDDWHIIINNSNKKIIENIFSTYSLYLLKKDIYIKNIEIKMNKILKYSEISKLINPILKNKNNDIIYDINELNYNAFKEYEKNNNIIINKLENTDELTIDSINNNLLTMLLNWFYSLIINEIKQYYIFNSNESINTELYSISEYGEDWKIITTKEYNMYDLLTLPLIDTLTHPYIEIDWFSNYEQNKNLLATNEYDIINIPLIKIDNTTYFISNYKLNDSNLYFLTNQQKNSDSFNILNDWKNINLNIHSLLSLIKLSIKEYIEKNINWNSLILIWKRKNILIKQYLI